MSRSILVFSFVVVVAIVLLLVGCSGNSSNSQSGFVNVSVSDPPTCSAPSGPYSHVFVTVTDVTIHASANARPNDSGWVDLTPNLKNSPQQVDLLAQANTECFLAMLGSGRQPLATDRPASPRMTLSIMSIATGLWPPIGMMMSA